MPEQAQQYRKFMSALILGGLMYVMNKYGISPDDLAAVGLSIGDVQQGVLGFLQVVALPAIVSVLAQPNEVGKTLRQYFWPWIVGGAGALVAIGAAVVLVPMAF